MKRFLPLICLLLTCLVARAEVTNVSTLEELKAAIKSNADIKLTADIDISSLGMLDVTFSGTIDGEGTQIIEGKEERIFHSLYGGTGNSRVKKPIFKALNGATLKNLIIRNFRLDWDDDQVGAVAKTAKNSQFNQVLLANISIFNDDDEAGAIVGRAENCDFRGVKGMENDVTVDGDRAGGFVGKSLNCVYSDCSNSAFSFVYADGSWGTAYAGGLVGESTNDQFVFCVNFASVGALDDRVGGIAGYSANSNFTNCMNSGLVCHAEEDDFLKSVSNLKTNLKKQIDEQIAAIKDDLDEHYKDQAFNLTAGLITFIGGVGGATIAWGVELCLLSSAALGPLGFPITLILVGVTIVVSVIELIAAEIGAHDEVGGICGSCECGHFNTCANYGPCLCRDSYVGGIVGLIGDRYGHSEIIDCLNAGNIQGFDCVGGIYGEHPYARDKIYHCLNVGKVEIKEGDGKCSPIGNTNRKETENPTQTYNYYKGKVGDPTEGGMEPVTEEDLKNGTVANTLNGGASGENAPWHQNADDDYPHPDISREVADPQKMGNVFTVSSAEDLTTLRTSVNAGEQSSYVVYFCDDIDCSGIENFTPIGTSTHRFVGLVYGNGHTIKNLNIDSEGNGIGLFGVVGLNTEIHALNIGEGSSITGNHGVGALIGYAEYADNVEGWVKLIGCGNAASVTADYDCGALIGGVYTDSKLVLTLDNCWNTGTVTGNNQTAALCGFAKKKAVITSCWTTGTVTGYDTTMPFVRGDSGEDAPTIRNCYYYESLSYLKQGDSMYPFSDKDAKDGTLCLNLNGKSNDGSVGLPWGQDISSEDTYPTYKDKTEYRKGIYTSRTVSNYYGTIVLPYNVTSDENIQYYTLSSATTGDETQLHFKAVTDLTAGTPALFRVAEKNATYQFFSTYDAYDRTTDNSVTKDGWTMRGNLSDENKVFTSSLHSLYYISGDQIKTATDKLTVAPFRAYIEGPTGASARALSLSFDDGTTGLRLVSEETQNGTTTYGIYNLSGQRVDASRKGIVIVNGKKILQK